MGDLLDDFLEELRKRQAAGRGEPRRVGPNADGPDNGDGDGDGPGDGADEPDDDAEGRPDDDAPEPLRPRPARRPVRSSGGRSIRGSFLLAVLVLLILFVLLFGRSLVDLWTDILWYRSVGFESVLWTRLGAQAALFLIGLVGVLAVLLGNLWLAGRLAPPPTTGAGSGLRSWFERLSEAGAGFETRGGGWPGAGPRPRARVPREDLQLEMPDLTPLARWAIAGFAVLVALGAGGALAGAWQTVVLWQHQVPFGTTGAPVTDPVFNRDIGFFLFELPFLRLVQSTVVALVAVSFLVAGARYFLAAMGPGLRFTGGVRLHLAVLAGIYLLAIAFGYQLDKLELAYSSRGVATGVSFTDANAQFLAYDVLTVISALAAAFVVGAAATGWVWPLGATVAVWFLASILVGRVYPELVQRLTVAPNQFAKEQPYVANNIAMTRLAFGFSGPGGTAVWDDSRRYQGNQPLTQAAIDSDQATFQNARLWDYRPLGDTLDQLQTIRRYYDFFDVDTDRYQIAGQERQVMISARELDLEGNPNATGFVNQRIVFTHGIGVAMVPVNEVASDGQPVLFIRNLPPASSNGAPPVTEPRIYFGERPSNYIVVGAKQNEFDYPRGDESAGQTGQTGQTSQTETAGTETRWTGTTGIPLDTTLNRLLFAARFGDLDLLISDQVTSQSQILMHRTLSDRVPLIAPFLRFDRDPYIVVNDKGGLTYLWDAYTTSDRFPHSSPFSPSALADDSGLAGDPFNYIRNSVKIAVNAYDGSMTFYVNDPTDPLIRAWEGVFPGLFHPLSEMPADLAAHLRTPEEMFNVQTRMYGRYHVTDPLTFYSNNDLWTVPTGKTSDQSLPSEAYYVVMRMPGESQAEFLLLQPMVPTNRPNMIAWVAARNDGANRGGVRVYRFPVDSTVFGPAQIEARIDQDPTISAQISLWNQSGSKVIRGNLIVVPVGDSLLYLQPVYLQSTASAFPEFQRIIVASASEVVWSPTLGQSLGLLLQAQGQPSPNPSGSPGPSPSGGPPPTSQPSATPTPSGGGGLPSDIPGLVAFANTHFQLAQEALRAGDFARYGQEINLVDEALRRLDELTGAVASPPGGSPGASPAPSPSASP